MKNLIWILVIMTMSTANAQKRNELKGPEAKNYKPWAYKTEATTSVTTVDKSSLKSKDVKNYKAWKKEDQATQEIVLATNNNKNKLRSPQAKNYKPWLN